EVPVYQPPVVVGRRGCVVLIIGVRQTLILGVAPVALGHLVLVLPILLAALQGRPGHLVIFVGAAVCLGDAGVLLELFVGVHYEALPLFHDQLQVVLVQGVQDGLHDDVPGGGRYVVVLLQQDLAQGGHGDAVVVLEGLLLVYPLQEVEPVLDQDLYLLLRVLDDGDEDGEEEGGDDCGEVARYLPVL
ncbi:MAG: hypothetical protein ACMG6E_08380, partial [Candidatus Roizmanbacteria bacterium]